MIHVMINMGMNMNMRMTMGTTMPMTLTTMTTTVQAIEDILFSEHVLVRNLSVPVGEQEMGCCSQTKAYTNIELPGRFTG